MILEYIQNMYVYEMKTILGHGDPNENDKLTSYSSKRCNE